MCLLGSAAGCMCVLCSRCRCQVVPSTVGSWQAVRQWSDWSKTTREEQAELPAAIRLPVSDGYGQGSQICSARSCYAVRESHCSQGDSVNHSVVMSTGNLTWFLMGRFVSATMLSFYLHQWASFQPQWCGTNNVSMMNWFKVKSLIFAPVWAWDQSLEQIHFSVSCTQTHQHNGFLPKLW